MCALPQQDVIKEIAASNPLHAGETKGPGFKVVVLMEVDRLTKQVCISIV
jgi:hypothetical protein